MSGIEKTVHIIPLGHEIDRAVIPFETRKADLVYILTNLEELNSHADMSRQQRYYAETVRANLKENGINVTCISVNLFDIQQVMKAVSKIIVDEKSRNNRIFLNMSAAGRLTSVAATLVGMAHNVQVYYVQADNYPENTTDRSKHGLSICNTGEITSLINFQIVLPEPIGLELLLHLVKKEKARMTDLLYVLQEKKCEGFEERFQKKRMTESDRKIQSKQLMKLDKRILARLEREGFVKRSKDGNAVYITITDSGKYASYMSGRLE